MQDDYLDAFGDPEKFGKQVGGDIISNKKTFLLIHALETASADRKKQLDALMNSNVLIIKWMRFCNCLKNVK